MDYLSDLPRYAGPGYFQTVFDDKSGYGHICLSPSSRTLLGLSWKGYFVYNTLPFGWKASAYVYHSAGLLATSYVRTLSVPCSQYIDDRHAGQLMVRRKPTSQIWSDFELAQAAAFILVLVLTSLGYTLALSSQRICFLGYVSDSVLMAFVLPEDKKLKFNTLREFILSQESVDLKTLQRFTGKTILFSIALPAARLYTCASFHAILSGSKSPHKPLIVAGDLLREIQYWRFLDNWQGCLPWLFLFFFSDASNSGWGGVFPDKSGNYVQGCDYWSSVDSSQPRIIREALALKNTLMAGAASLATSRVDAHVDSLPLVRAWTNQGSKSKALTDVVQAIHETSLQFNVALSLVYVPSKGNLADAPSRALSSSDCMLSLHVWVDIEKRWGPYSVDLMALDSNTPLDAQGHPLKHFPPGQLKTSLGLMFFLTLHHLDNAYMFPPLTLTGILLRFLDSQPCPFTIVLPDAFLWCYW